MSYNLTGNRMPGFQAGGSRDAQRLVGKSPSPVKTDHCTESTGIPLFFNSPLSSHQQASSKISTRAKLYRAGTEGFGTDAQELHGTRPFKWIQSFRENICDLEFSNDVLNRNPWVIRSGIKETVRIYSSRTRDVLELRPSAFDRQLNDWFVVFQYNQLGETFDLRHCCRYVIEFAQESIKLCGPFEPYI